MISRSRRRRRFSASGGSGSEGVWALLLLLPFLVALLLFIVGPTIVALVLSFTNWDLIGSPHWNGLTNYRELLADSTFRTVLLNTGYYTIVVVPVTIAIALLVAVLLRNRRPGFGVMRALLFAPATVPVIAAGLLWSWVMTPSYGMLDYLLHLIGLPQFAWIAGLRTSMPSIILVGVWRSAGLDIVILLAGLQGLDPSIEEAAEMDGAGRVRRFVSVTLPLLTPTLFFTVIIGIIGSFQVFDQTYVMTQGGPGYSTLTIIYYIFLEGFTYLRMGYASAISVVFTIIVFCITAIGIRYQRLWVFYGD